MNKMALTNLLKKKAKESTVPYDALQLSYFFEVFLKNLADSQYKDNFYLKGGLLLSSMMGIENRRTTDIDFLLTNENMDEKNLKHIVAEIIAPKPGALVNFNLTKIRKIKKDDIYGGFTVSLEGRLENIKQSFSIDFATGDPISGQPLDYPYKPIIDDKPIQIHAYNLETILAEKIQTIFVKGLTNTRYKDFFDIYIIEKSKRSLINKETLNQALIATFAHRLTNFNRPEIIDLLLQISESSTMNKEWQKYVKKNPYANGIEFKDTVDCIIKLL